MQFTLDIPDAMAHSLDLNGPAKNRQALEMLALEGYREGKLSRGQVSEALELSFYETEAFLHRHGAQIQMSVDEYEQEFADLQRLLAK